MHPDRIRRLTDISLSPTNLGLYLYMSSALRTRLKTYNPYKLVVQPTARHHGNTPPFLLSPFLIRSMRVAFKFVLTTHHLLSSTDICGFSQQHHLRECRLVALSTAVVTLFCRCLMPHIYPVRLVRILHRQEVARDWLCLPRSESFTSSSSRSHLVVGSLRQTQFPPTSSVIDFIFRCSDISQVSVDTVHPSLLPSSSHSSPR